MEHLSSIGVVLVIFSLIVLVASAWAVARSAYTSARADDAEKRIASLRGEIEDRKRNEDDLEKRLVALTARVKALEDENNTLRSFVPTQDEMEEVKRIAKIHYEEATSNWRLERESMSKLMEAVNRVVSGINSLLESMKGRGGIDGR